MVVLADEIAEQVHVELEGTENDQELGFGAVVENVHVVELRPEAGVEFGIEAEHGAEVGAEAGAETEAVAVAGAGAEAGAAAGAEAGAGAVPEDGPVPGVVVGYLTEVVVVEAQYGDVGVVAEAAAHMLVVDLELQAVEQPAYYFVGIVDKFAVDIGHTVGTAADKGHIQDTADNIVDIEVVVVGTTALP